MRYLRKGSDGSDAQRHAGSPVPDRQSKRILHAVVIAATFLMLSACRRGLISRDPAVGFTYLPPVFSGGGPDILDHISGHAATGGEDVQLVLYAHTDAWYVQPYRNHPFTEIRPDGSWNNLTHLGSEYAAVLVRRGHKPRGRIRALPAPGGDIVAIMVAKGSVDPLNAFKDLRFSGYDWKVRSSLGDAGGEVCNYAASNVWVDEKGYLHLRMNGDEAQWQCAGVSLTRSLGYGTYRFVIADSSHLPASAIFAIFTRTEAEDPMNKTGLAIQLGRWGRKQTVNADYVVEPYYITGNTANLKVPAGAMTHTLRWQPGTAEFMSVRGSSAVSGKVVMDHVFKSGIPVPATETIRMDFYDWHHSRSGLQRPVEIVVQRFEYLP